MKATIRPIHDKLIEQGFHYAGTCACASRAMKYKKAGNWMIKVFPTGMAIKLYHKNLSLTPYEKFEKLDEVLQKTVSIP